MEVFLILSIPRLLFVCHGYCTYLTCRYHWYVGRGSCDGISREFGRKEGTKYRVRGEACGKSRRPDATCRREILKEADHPLAHPASHLGLQVALQHPRTSRVCNLPRRGHDKRAHTVSERLSHRQNEVANACWVIG